MIGNLEHTKLSTAIVLFLISTIADAAEWSAEIKKNEYRRTECHIVTTTDGNEIRVGQMWLSDGESTYPHERGIRFNGHLVNASKIYINGKPLGGIVDSVSREGALAKFDGGEALDLNENYDYSGESRSFLRKLLDDIDHYRTSFPYRYGTNELLRRMIQGREMRIKDAQNTVYVIPLIGVSRSINECVKHLIESRAHRERQEENRKNF